MGKTTETKPPPVKQTSQKITIINNATRLVTLTYLVGAKGSQSQSVALTLKPGPNAVDRHVYEEHFAKHPMVLRYRGIAGDGKASGRVKFADGKSPILEVDTSGPPTTVGKTDDEAVEFVGKICDTDLLYALKEVDSRAAVQKACDERKTEITEIPKKKD